MGDTGASSNPSRYLQIHFAECWGDEERHALGMLGSMPFDMPHATAASGGCLTRHQFVLGYGAELAGVRFSAASFSAVLSASAAGTFMSGSTPVPSQLVFVIGFMDCANGTWMT